jgi:hypothetical protein
VTTEAQPGRFYVPAYIASRGWVALRLDIGKIDWNEVKELLFGSYALVALRDSSREYPIFSKNNLRLPHPRSCLSSDRMQN